MTELFLLIVIGISSFIPVPDLMQWIRKEFSPAPTEALKQGKVYFDGSVVLAGWIILFQFLKGFFIVWALHHQLDWPLVTAAAISVMALVQYWISGHGLAHRPYSIYLIWGIFAGFSPIWIIAFPAFILAGALILNSLDLALTTVIGGIAFWFAFIIQESAWVTAGIFALFVITAFAYLTAILQYFEGEDGLVQRFDDRE